MKREIELEFQRWADEGCTEPLVVTGLRGCGKTTTTRRFVEENFPVYSFFDFERDGLRDILSDGSARSAASRLKAVVDGSLEDGSLIVIDSLRTRGQATACSNALRALSAQYKVIAICTSDGFGEGFRRIRMGPMSFTEYLSATGREDLARDVRRGRFDESLSNIFSEFVAVGGLPAAVSAWSATGSEREVDRAIRDTVTSVCQDAGREGGEACEKYAGRILESIPEQLARRNKKFMYAKSIPGARAKDLAYPIDVLEGMGAVQRVPIYEDSGEGCGFKLYCADTGVLRVLYGMPIDFASRIRAGDEFLKGTMENAVLLELMKSGYSGIRCWRSGNRAEAELVINNKGEDVPIQVETTGCLYARSLREYDSRHSPRNMVFLSPFGARDMEGAIHLPVYAVCAIRDTLI